MFYNKFTNLFRILSKRICSESITRIEIYITITFHQTSVYIISLKILVYRHSGRMLHFCVIKGILHELQCYTVTRERVVVD